MQTVFITGAEGYAGSALLEHLSDRGYDVVAGVRNRARKLAYERRHVKAWVCDVSDAINLARVVAEVRPDAVIHLAGIAHPTDAADEPLEAFQSIVTAWANVLDAVRRTVPRARVVLASACDVYGDAGRDGRPLSEAAVPQPSSTFGSLKRVAENLADIFHRDYSVDVLIARPFHYTGPRQPRRFFLGAVAQRLFEWDASTHGNVLRLPDLSCRRDLLHVKDVAAAYEHILRHGRPNQVYNICSGDTLTVRECVEALVTELGRNIELADLATAEDDAQIKVLWGDPAKLRTELNWEPTHNVHDALAELAQSCQARADALAK